MSEGINATLQESLLTLLCWNAEHGKILANVLDPSLMDAEFFREIAEPAIDYWRAYGRPPANHLDDLLAKELTDDKGRAGTFRRILFQMQQFHPLVNAVYVMARFDAFTRTQTIKRAILESSEKLHALQEGALSEVEAIWSDLLRTREVAFAPGMRLTDYERVIAFGQQHFGEFTTCIKEFNQANVVPARKMVMLVLASTGLGKTWFLIDTGKRAAVEARKKVLHISCEMGEEEIAQRYYQNLFAAPKRMPADGVVEGLKFEFEDKKLVGFDKRLIRPEFALDHEDIETELRVRVNHLGARLQNIVIKKFPIGTLTMNVLRAYVDTLEVQDKFIPDVMILDYLGAMKVDTKNPRFSLGSIANDFVGFCEERNVAGVTAHQISREGTKLPTADMTHVSEAWMITNPMHFVLTMSATKAEQDLGLARMFVNKARSETKLGVLLTQNYAIGQFCLQSTPMPYKYFDLLKDVEDEHEEDEDDGDGD